MSLRMAILPLLERCFAKGGILGYHAVVEEPVPSPEMHVSLGTLRAQLEYVRDRFEVIPLRELVQRRLSGRSMNRCVAITFDDAYVGVERLAAPLLARLDLPATIFVTAAAAAEGNGFWWDCLEHARLTSPDVLWPRLLRQLELDQHPATTTALGAVRNHVLTRHVGRVARTMDFPNSPNELLRSMTFEALGRLGRDVRFDFGSHTMTHPVLPFLSADEQAFEMLESQRRLEDVLPRVVPIIAYPFGFYDQETLTAAASAGFQAGVTMQARAVSSRDSVLALPRVGVSEDWSHSAISVRLNAGMRHLFTARAGTHPRLPIQPVLHTNSA
jgi:peptidoglycan/xylan/chitin deacetylase (PgdA/CDA1 family)